MSCWLFSIFTASNEMPLKRYLVAPQTLVSWYSHGFSILIINFLSVQTCCLVPSCGKAPVTFLHASAVASDLAKTTYGSTVRYECDSGYEREGDLVLRSNSEAQWNGTIKCTGRYYGTATSVASF